MYISTKSQMRVCWAYGSSYCTEGVVGRLIKIIFLIFTRKSTPWVLFGNRTPVPPVISFFPFTKIHGKLSQAGMRPL